MYLQAAWWAVYGALAWCLNLPTTSLGAQGNCCRGKGKRIMHGGGRLLSIPAHRKHGGYITVTRVPLGSHVIPQTSPTSLPPGLGLVSGVSLEALLPIVGLNFAISGGSKPKSLSLGA